MIQPIRRINHALRLALTVNPGISTEYRQTDMWSPLIPHVIGCGHRTIHQATNPVAALYTTLNAAV
ncbi:hypothetical protein J6590_075003 [Homalodisca vitripennis]|nr:hypothetical protein J6590_075003 [Homalodisca vitripennis]